MASLLSDAASTALTRLASPALQELASAWHFKSDLLRLENTMATIKDALRAADDDDGRQIPGGFESLIERLRDIVYEADDFFDEITTLTKRKGLTMSHGGFAKEVRTFFSRENQAVTAFTVSSKIKKISKALDDIVKDCELTSKFPLTERMEPPCVVKGRETWSLGEDVIGREDEKQKILGVLLRDDCNDPAVVVLAIVGIGGHGKTTVAQFAFNDEGVKNHFNYMLWVCIGEKIGLKGIIRRIMSATGDNCQVDESLDQLQNEVRGKIGGKRYLLVLDDLWDDDPLELSQLRSLLSAGDKGSRVLVTSRSIDIAQRLKSNHILELQGLSDDASWKLFAKMAFESEQQENDERRVQIGKEIVKKCANSPLAIKVVGSLLCGKDIAQWGYFKDRDLADIDTTNSIMPLLKLSYYRLSPRLRSCFTYCSLFPKDYRIEKIQLCYLWIAQGFITSTTQSQNESLEDVAEQCFMELLQRCFFQDIRRNRLGEIESFKMHDLLHDLAQDVGKKEILLTDKRGAEITFDKSIRHLATTSRFGAIGLPNSPSLLHGGGNHLRTYFISTSSVAFGVSVDISKIICLFQRIKVLDLSCLAIKLPECIGKLIHLRYLDLSRNNFEMLPTSITKLYNLETLKLFHCLNLKALPRDLSKLVNLQNLDLDGPYASHKLSHMPPGMGNLTHLRRLTQIVVGEGKSVKNASGFGDLKLLKNLGGSLKVKIYRKAITGSKSVETVKVRDCLLEKSKLTELRIQLERENETGDEEGQDEELLLESLQPHSNLKCFTLRGYYGGLRFPQWMSKDNLGRVLPNLVEFELSGCERLQHLPILSQLMSLRRLRLTKLLSLEYVESKSYEAPTTSTPVAFFASLKTLELWELANVKGWWPPPVSSTAPTCDRQYDVAQSPVQLPSFPPLSELRIHNCPNMTSMPLCSHVEYLVLHKFNERLFVFMETTEMCNSGSPSWSSPSSSSAPNRLSSEAPPPILKTLEIDSIDYLYQLPKWRLPSLKRLTIDGSQNVALSGRFFQHLTELVDLSIRDCPELELLAADEEENDEFMPWKFLQRLRYLHLQVLPKLETIPQGLNYLTNLQELSFHDCGNLSEVPDGIRGLTSLRYIELLGCDGLKERCREGTGEDWPKIQHIPEKYLPDGVSDTEDGSSISFLQLALRYIYKFRRSNWKARLSYG